MAGGVLIDTANSGQFAAPYTSGQQGPQLVGVDLYALLIVGTPAAQMMKSTDGGVTWTIQDAAGEPAADSAAMWYDGAVTIWVAWTSSGNVLNMSAYDTATDTWGAAVAGPTSGDVWSATLRSDATIAVLNNQASGSQLWLSVFDTVGHSWGANVDIAVGIAALPEYSANVAALSPSSCTDGSNIFCVFQTIDTSSPQQMNGGVFYVQISLGGGLSNFFVFPGQIGSPSQPDPQDLRCDNGQFFGVPAYCGPGNIVVPVARNNPLLLPLQANYATVYATHDSGATWTERSTAIDPLVIGNFDSAQFAPMAFYAAGQLYIVYAQLTGPPGFIFPASAVRMCVTTPDFTASPDTWTFADSTISTITGIGKTPGTYGFSWPMLTFQGGQPLLSSDVANLTGVPTSIAAWSLNINLSPLIAGRIMGHPVAVVLAGQVSG